MNRISFYGPRFTYSTCRVINAVTILDGDDGKLVKLN